ncbi:MAG: phosphopyruvate hydratase, partial [Candidatus Magasanikbacteria bacterium]
MSDIKNISALEILDSRGNPTLRTWVELKDGTEAQAAVPSGASTGVHEAVELRDENKDRFHGKGVRKAVENVNKEIFSELKGISADNQRKIDQAMISLDGTDNKENLGANAILSVSLAVARAAAKSGEVPLYQHIRENFDLDLSSYNFPTPTMNVINGGEHANNALTAQEFMIVPVLDNFSENVRVGSEIFHQLKDILNNQDYSTAVGDEGGFAPNLNSNEEALELLVKSIEKTGYEPGTEVGLATDIAAGEFFQDGKYQFYENGGPIKKNELIEEVEDWVEKYPLISIEDPLDQDDWEGWQELTKRLGNEVDIVGDDLFVTNKERLKKGIDMDVANAILIKVNQIGSLTETIEAIKLAQKNNYNISVSHRSGETADTFISDLALAVNSE